MVKRIASASIAALLVMGAATPGLAQSSPDGRTFTVHLDSEDSWRSYYREFGILFDGEATEALRQEQERKCFVEWSRRMGNLPRAVKFLGMAYLDTDASRELRPICMLARPNTNTEAAKLCDALGRTLLENIPIEMEIRCGPKFEDPRKS